MNHHPIRSERERMELIWDMKLYGCKNADIARYFGVHRQTVGDIYRKLLRRRRCST